MPSFPPVAGSPALSSDSYGKPLGVKNSATNKISVYGANLGRFARSKVLRKMRSGLLTLVPVAAGGVITNLEQIVIPAPYTAIRIGVLNADPSASPQIRVRIGSTESANIVAQTISSITFSGTTATLTTSTPHNLPTGTYITVAGATPSDYNAVSAMTIVSPTSFTYTMATTPATNATVVGSYSIAINGLVQGGVSTMNYTQVTFAGSNNGGNLDAVAGSTVTNPNIQWSDKWPLISLPRTDGGTGNILNVIIEQYAYNNGVTAAMNITQQWFDSTITGWEIDGVGGPINRQFHRTRSMNIGGGVLPASMTSTVPGSSTGAAIIVEYTLANGTGTQVIIGGDSTANGTGDSIDKYGWFWQALHKASTPDNPIEGLCIAQAGTSLINFRSMARTFIPEAPNSIFIYPTGSPNVTLPLHDQVLSATIVSGGSGGANGPVTLQGTTGTGTKFQATGVIVGGAVTSITGISTVGSYTKLPTNVTAEPVTAITGGVGLTGCVLSLNTAGVFWPLNLSYLAGIKAVAEANGCAPIQTTWLPASTSGRDYQNSDFLRVQANDQLRRSGQIYIDYDAAVTGPLVGTQFQIAAGLTTDGLHLNAAGHVVQEAEFSKFISQFTGV